MAFGVNSFAALEDADGDDLDKILARPRAAKAEQQPSAVEKPPKTFSSTNPRNSSGHAGKGSHLNNGVKSSFKQHDEHNKHGNGLNRYTARANGNQKDENRKDGNGWQNTGRLRNNVNDVYDHKNQHVSQGQNGVFKGVMDKFSEVEKGGDTNAGAEWVHEASKESVSNKGKHDRVLSQEEIERLVENELEAKKMTLKEYEKQFEEKRKGLVSFKTKERKVSLDKDFDSMHIVGKKNEESVKSDCGKMKKVTMENNNNIVRKALVTNFKRVSPSYSERRGGYTGRVKDTNVLPLIEDTKEFPSLGGSQ